MKKLMKFTVLTTIALTAIGVAARAICKLDKKVKYIDYFVNANFKNLDKYLSERI